MTTRQYVFLVVLFFLSVFVAYQVAAWQMTPKHAQLLVAVKGPDSVFLVG